MELSSREPGTGRKKSMAPLYAVLGTFVLYEFLKAYVLLPFPGGQEMVSIDLAYFLNRYVLFFRIGFVILAACSYAYGRPALRNPWVWISMTLALLVICLLNFSLTAENMFARPGQLVFEQWAMNSLDDNSLVIGVESNDEAKSYPVRIIAYHHQVEDTIGGIPILVTYCDICRTARVFQPQVKGRHEKFRLVGMNRFNSMLEDATTKSWWRQATGKAVAGPLKGETLAQIDHMQVTAGKWFELYPDAVMMQADPSARKHYDSLGLFEEGISDDPLFRTDMESWKEKSWIVGLEADAETKAYDWGLLKVRRIINDRIGDRDVVLAIGSDNRTFAAYERPGDLLFTIRNDSLFAGQNVYDLAGRDLRAPTQRLQRVRASQEFWESWLTFHPETERYGYE